MDVIRSTDRFTKLHPRYKYGTIISEVEVCLVIKQTKGNVSTLDDRRMCVAARRVLLVVLMAGGITTTLIFW